MSDVTAHPENWREIPGYEGYYQVSDLGHIRSMDRIVTYRTGRQQRYVGHPVPASSHRDGHLLVNLWRDNKGRTDAVHRLVMAAFAGPPPEGHEVCHEDGDPANNNLTNLRYDTRSSNRFDAVHHGTDRNVRKTHCPRRHALAEPNLVPSQARKGRRTCRACGRANSRTIKARRAGRPVLDFQTLSDQIYTELIATAAA